MHLVWKLGSEEAVEHLQRGHPEPTAASGDDDALAGFAKALRRSGLESKRLQVLHRWRSSEKY
jgi:hypothetical protein